MGALINEVQPYANNPATKKGRLRAAAITIADAIPNSRDAKINGRVPKRSEKIPGWYLHDCHRYPDHTEYSADLDCIRIPHLES